ncbi:uncharacterized protein METZ01_LOCUS165096 [marine metagenome]|uniref:Glycosyltransferase n=1 Tax=marine metagenome TaxID=408172 RepID=A0A382BG35_9ZZZZ
MHSIVVFAKDPRPGSVKTRLTPFLSPEEAADLYQAFIRDTLRTALCVPGTQTCVAFTPQEAEASLQALTESNDIEWFPQSGDSLGSRLQAAFDHAFQQGASRVVTIGSDCPSLQPSVLSQAFEALSGSDVVLGPATDGGYYLIGLANQGSESDRYRTLFKDIAWSTETVYEQTLGAIDDVRLTLMELPEWSDVDKPVDLLRLIDQIRSRRGAGDRDLALHTEPMLHTLLSRIETASI